MKYDVKKGSRIVSEGRSLSGGLQHAAHRLEGMGEKPTVANAMKHGFVLTKTHADAAKERIDGKGSVDPYHDENIADWHDRHCTHDKD